MIEQVAEAVWRIGVALPGNPLGELNSYFIRGEQRDLLIDTGFRREECRKELEDGLQALHSDRDRLDVFVTHCHSDHGGLANDIVGKNGHIYMSLTDLAQFREMVYGDFHAKRCRRFSKEGFDPSLLDEAYSSNPARIMAAREITEQYVGLGPGARISLGSCELEVLMMPGHSPGNTMLWEEKRRIMFTGDHILYDITPNITLWDDETDFLGLYLNSLREAASYPVVRSFPGHRKSGDYHKRIAELLDHHDQRLEEVLDIVRARPGLTAYEIASHMRWNFHADRWEKAQAAQKWFATGECLAHLEHLRRMDLVIKNYDGAVYTYRYVKDRLTG